MQVVTTAVLVVALFAPATALADLYRYETESGTIAFTDDVNRIPARYRPDAKRQTERGLQSYRRLTVVPRGATYAPKRVFEEESEPRKPEAAESAPAPATPSLEIAIDRRSAIEIPLDSDEPITVLRDQYRYLDDRALGTYKPFTVIKQGDKVIAEIEPH